MFLLLLTFLYTGTAVLTEENALEVMALANQYNVSPLRKRCEY